MEVPKVADSAKFAGRYAELVASPSNPNAEGDAGWIPKAPRKGRPHTVRSRVRSRRVVSRVASAEDWARWESKSDPNSPLWRGVEIRLERIARLRRRLGPAKNPQLRAELVAELDRQVSLLPAVVRGRFEGKW